MKSTLKLSIVPCVLLLSAAIAACGSTQSATGSGASVGAPTSASVSLLRRCPAEAPLPPESGLSPGAKGHAVPAGPVRALVCRWTASNGQAHDAEGTVRGAALAGLSRALNALPPVEEGEETEGCGGGPSVGYMVALGYAGEPEVRVVARLGEGEFCDSAINLDEGGVYVGTDQLRSVLDRDLEGDAGAR